MAAVKVPTIDKRTRIPQKAIDQVVKQIVEKFKPQKIFLCILLLALVPGLTACKWEQKRELSLNREKWQAQDITDYRYEISIISYWGENALMPLTLEYRNGQLISVVDTEGNVQELFWDRLGGINAVFQEVEDALARKKRKVEEIEYDPAFGFPTFVYIFYNQTGVGAEYTRRYTISHFEVLSEP